MLRVINLLTAGMIIVVVGLVAQLGSISSADEEAIGGDEMPAEDELKVTVGEPIVMAPAPGYTNQATLAVSRTGAVAALYECLGPEGTKVRVRRVSPDGGRTWGEEMPWPLPDSLAMSVGLREGGVLAMTGQATPDPKDERAPRWSLFSDDFRRYESSVATVDLPNAVLNTKWARFYPVFDKGKIVQLATGDLLATMYGNLEGDTQYRTMIVRSTDRGRTWQYRATVAYDPNDPNPELSIGMGKYCEYCGYCEPSLALLPDGQLLCMMRTQGAQHPPDYRPMYTSWSDDEGRTWTKPIPTQPYLNNVWPTLAVLDNGVVACIYGRPGVHVVFSTDQGHTWTNRVTFTDRPEPETTGYADMVKVGPNKLLAIAGLGDPDGTRVFPITVERMRH